jgi:hypothetical protein
MRASVPFVRTIILGSIIVIVGVVATGAPADDDSARTKLVGTWQPQESSNKDSGIWTLQSKGVDVLRVTSSLGDQKMADFECSTKGRECDMKDSGKSAKVSMWFSGSKLVELETRGQEVVKRLFSVAPLGDILEIEIIPIQPDGKTETLRFRRIQR